MKQKIRTLFKNTFLRNVLIISFAAVIMLPLYIVLFAYPSFRERLIADSEEHALLTAVHLAGMLREIELKKGSLPDTFPEFAEHVKRDFNLMKLKIFSGSGEILYSTDPKDIGNVNRETYFQKIVAKGKNYTEVVNKDKRSLENQIVTADVVETYVPIMRNNTFAGAFEIYLDITDRKRNLDRLISRSSAIIFTIAVCLLTMVIITAYKAIRHIESQEKAEEEVLRLNSALEQKVKERTSQLVEAREELARKEKLSIIGQLAGSVGHELRNPLGVMSNALYYLKTVMPGPDETVKEYLDIIKSEIDNSERIISDLLDFSRVKTPQTQSAVVDELIKQSLEKCSVPENVTVRLDIPDKIPAIKVDPFQMSQVLQNLVTNGIQAMPKGGALHITARQVKGKELGDSSMKEASSHLTPHISQDFIEISITDTGEGISHENMAKLFQPLFTTKARGIGLGLIVSKNMVEANGGRIKVESQSGKGTTFTVTLPVGEKKS